MTDMTKEQLSALSDGALSDAEVERVLSKCKDDDALRRCWYRYHLIGDAMKNNLPTHIDLDLSARIAQAIDNEPTILAPRINNKPNERSTHTWLKRAAGVAIAASVASVAILSVQMPARMAGQGAALSVAAGTPPATLARQVADNRDGKASGVESRINKYLVNHHEYAINASMPGVLPYARIVGQSHAQK